MFKSLKNKNNLRIIKAQILIKANRGITEIGKIADADKDIVCLLKRICLMVLTCPKSCTHLFYFVKKSLVF